MKDRLLALCACLVLAAGCPSSGGTPGPDGGGAGAGGGAGGGATGGRAGSTGAAGSAGAAGGTSGGAGGRDAGATTGDASEDGAPPTDGGNVCFPACLTDLGIPCPRLGQSCVSSTAANGDVSSCYANGVKALATATMTTIKKPSGDACFQINVMTGGQDYLAPSGAVAAHLAYTASSSQYIVTCADGTASYVDLTSPECATTAGGMQTCTAGSCSY